MIRTLSSRATIAAGTTAPPGTHNPPLDGRAWASHGVCGPRLPRRLRGPVLQRGPHVIGHARVWGGNARHDEDVADAKARRGRDLVVDQLAARRDPRHPHARLVELGAAE